MAEASRGPGRFEYEDDAGSSQGLWILALVVAAVVSSFLFGRYVIGEKLKGSPAQASAQAPAVAPAAALGQQPGTTSNSPVSITSSDAAAANGTAAGTLDAGMNNAAATTDPMASTAAPVAEPPKPATTTTTTAEAQPSKPKSTGGSSSGKSLNGGYDKAQPGKPFKPSTTSGKTSSSSSKSTADKAGSSDTPWRVQAGSYGSKDAADKQRKDLAAKGHQSSVREAEVKGKTVYRVVISTHRDESRARDVAKQVEKDGFDVSVEH